MAYKNQPSKVSATQWGKTVTIEVDHSDTDLLELIEMFKGLAVGLEYSESSWRSVIKDLGVLYEEEDTEDLKNQLNAWKEEDSIDRYVRGLNESEIDAALAEHNRHEEELEEWDTTNLDGLPKVDHVLRNETHFLFVETIQDAEIIEDYQEVVEEAHS
jgi:hypothetical protein